MSFRNRASHRKRPANVTVDNELLEKARRHGINLSLSLEDRLIALIREKEREDWLRQNSAAIEAYNRRVERDGMFSEGLRTF